MGYIKKVNLLEKDIDNQRLVLALGFFDVIHKGHLEIFKKINDISKLNNLETAIFTFKNIISNNIKERKNEIYDFEKRSQIYKANGIKKIIYADATKNFCNLLPFEFFEILTSNYNIKHIVVGADYRFGHLGQGDTDTLKEYTTKKNIDLTIVDILNLENKKIKISASYIKELLQEGKVEDVNKLLFEKYNIESYVVEGKKIGRTIGFPTANFEILIDKLFLKNGVYITKSYINGKEYKSITNIGMHPTTDNLKANIETHIIDFNLNIYDKKLKLEFHKFIRDTEKFENLDYLVKRLEKDKEETLEYFKNEKL